MDKRLKELCSTLEELTEIRNQACHDETERLYNQAVTKLMIGCAMDIRWANHFINFALGVLIGIAIRIL